MPILNIGLGYGEIQGFLLVVDFYVQLKTAGKSHCGPVRGGNTFDHFATVFALVLTDPYKGGVNGGYAGTPPNSRFSGTFHSHQTFLYELGKPIIGNGAGKFIFNMVFDVTRFTGPKTAQLKNNSNCHDFALGYHQSSLGGVSQKDLVNNFRVFLAEFIDQKINFSNFKIDYHG